MATQLLILRRLYLDCDGYARKGRDYFGHGLPLYEYETPDGYICELRAANRSSALAQLKMQYPTARFFGPAN